MYLADAAKSVSICLVSVATLTFSTISLRTAAFAGVASPTAGPTASPSASGSPSAAKEDAPSVSVGGFRSAQFGMDEAQVRAAATKDFGHDGKALDFKNGGNAAERTRSLTTRVPNVLPEGGTADVAYVFGYKTKKLIQISIVWSKVTDPTMTAEKLVADADVLRANFAEQGYKQDTVVSDVAVRNGILVFRGADSAGHTTALLLEGRTAADKDHKVFTPASLLILYIADPKHPDVFRLAPGQF